MKTKFVELHILQNLPPSCVNRDGNNSPKDCEFGGHRRARISSQCLKRSIRHSDGFRESIEGDLGIRSKQWLETCTNYLSLKGVEAADEKAREFLAKLASFDKKKTEQTNVLLYFSNPEMEALMDRFVEGGKIDKESPSHLSPDIALFGRMLAEAANLNVDAASQIAHAISTQRLSQEMDYWTAVDDISERNEQTGAGMMGVAEFNSSCFYRYACVSIPLLKQNLGKDEHLTRVAVKAFIQGSIDAYPGGKQSSFAHFSPPDLVLAAVRESGCPINLANAFVCPIKGEGEGLVTNSVKSLAKYYGDTSRLTGSVAKAFFCGTAQGSLAGLPDEGRRESYSALIESVVESMSF